MLDITTPLFHGCFKNKQFISAGDFFLAWKKECNIALKLELKLTHKRISVLVRQSFYRFIKPYVGARTTIPATIMFCVIYYRCYKMFPCSLICCYNVGSCSLKFVCGKKHHSCICMFVCFFLACV